MIFGGCALVATGFVCLGLYARAAKKSGELRRSVQRPAVLLLLNFPVCALYVAVAVTVGSASYFTVKNGLASPIDELTLIDASDRSISFGSIPPGTHTHCVGPFPEGPLRYEFSVGKQEWSGLQSGYVSGLDRRYELEVTQGPQVNVKTGTNLSSVPEYIRNCMLE